MKLASDALKIVTYEDAELAKKPPLRAGEQIAGGETENDNLIGLLGEIDGLKQEIHERMRRVEAVKQAKSVLLEDALRTAALNKRLAEMGRVMSSFHPGLLAIGHRSEDPESLRMQARELLADSEPRNIQGKGATEGVTLPWRKLEEPVESSIHEHVEQILQLSAGSAPQSEYQSISADASTAYQAAAQRLEQSEQEWADAWKRADEAAAEARRLFEESASRLDLAVSKEELAASQFESAKETLTTAYGSANERLEEAERCWQRTDQIVLEARQMLERSISELDQARRREEAVAASLESVRREFSTAYQSASQRLEEAERLCQKGDQAAKEAQHAIDQTTAELLQSRNSEEKAAADLLSARQELTTAYQFASVAAQRRLEAAETFQKAIRWAVFATAFSWVALVWALWLALRAIVPIWGGGVASALVILVAFVFGRLRTREI
jgi:hypothetical protein